MKKIFIFSLFLVFALSTNAGTLKFSGKELKFNDIENFLRKELQQVKPKPYNLFIQLTPQRKAQLSKKRFSLNLTGLSLREGLESFAKSSGLSVSIKGNVVTLSDNSKMIAKSYYVYTEFADSLQKNKQGKATSQATKQFLRSIGVQFPKGSGAKYNQKTNVVMMINTPANHKQLRDSLNGVHLLYK